MKFKISSLISRISLLLAAMSVSYVALACTCGVDCPPNRCMVIPPTTTMPPDKGWHCSWDQSDTSGYTPFRDQAATSIQATDQSVEIPLGLRPGTVTMPLYAAVPVWMWNPEVWKFVNTINYGSYTSYPAGDRAVAWALDAAMNTPQESMSINPNFWLRTHFYGKTSSVFSVDNQLSDINQLTGIVMSGDDPDGVGSLDQLYNGLCQQAGMYLSCASSRIPITGRQGGACYRSNASSSFAIVSPLNDLAMRVMEGASIVLVTENTSYVSGKKAYTYGGEKHAYFIKKMGNSMGATHDSDTTDINSDLSNGLYNLYNSDMTWAFALVDAVNGKTVWATIYNDTFRFMWSNGSVVRRKFSVLERSDGSWEMIRGYVGYDPIDVGAF